MPTMVLVPHILTEADHEDALARIDALIDAPDDSPEAHERAVLGHLAAAWEEAHHPAPALTGRKLLASCMKAAGLSQSQLPEVGPQPIVSAVLAGRRHINPRMSLALEKRFRIPASAFVE
jgi:HTH-type transcriptional regulator/antitoxin HigA